MKNFLLTIFVITGIFNLPVNAKAQVVIYGPTSGTYGNDTASTLYLRPLNNALLGNAYFVRGYPHEYSSVTYIQPTAQSGIQRANEYLTSSGWAAWQKEKQMLIAKNTALKEKLQSITEQIAKLESRLKELEAQSGSSR